MNRVDPVRQLAMTDPAAVEDRSNLPSETEPHPLSRQLTAIIWIFLAWMAGTVVFEIAAIGDEPKYVRSEAELDSRLGLYQAAPITPRHKQAVQKERSIVD